MRVNPYLLFSGRCEEAFRFYEKCLGGKIETVVRYAGTSAEQHVPPELRDQIMHLRMSIGDDVLMGSDAPPDRFAPPQGFSVALQFKNPAEAERVFHALAEGAKIGMPLGETFWAARFGMLVDRFGIPWMINCEPAAK